MASAIVRKSSRKSSASVIVGSDERGALVEKSGRRIARRDGAETPWCLRKVEAIENARGSRVGVAARRRADGRQVEYLFDELQNAAELVLRVRYVAGAETVSDARVGGNDDAGHANAEPAKIELRWRHIVVPAAPVVPKNDDRRRVPVRAAADRIDDRGHPRGTGVVAAARMIRVLPIRRHPRDVGEPAALDVAQNPSLRRFYVLPIAAVTDGPDRVELRPNLTPDLAQRRGVVTPRAPG